MSIKQAIKEVKDTIKGTKDEIRSSFEVILPEPVKPIRTVLQRRLPILRRSKSTSTS